MHHGLTETSTGRNGVYATRRLGRWRWIPAAVCLIALSLAGALGSAAAQEVRVEGTVFVDDNANGRMDEGEPGFAGAHVSDGDRIWETDVNGWYSVETTTAIPNTVFVINPDGYVSSGPFYHLVTGPATGLDFGLAAGAPDAKGRFSFIHGADYQYDLSKANRAQIQSDLDDMEALAGRRDIRFYAFVGDITNRGAMEELLFYKGLFDGLERPFHAMFGGHDGLVEMPRPKMGNFVEVFGPYAYSWNYGGVHFIALVSEGYLSDIERERQMRWWMRDMELLPPGKPIIVLAHVPDTISNELEEACSRYNVLAVLCGHWHIHYQYEAGGVGVFMSGPWRPLDWGAFTKRVRVFTYDQGRLTSTTRVLEQHKRIVILSPGDTAVPGPLELAACVYDTAVVPGGVSATVRSSDGGETWTQSLEAVDDWTWQAALPHSLVPGEYEIRVQGDDDDAWSARKRFAVIDRPVEAVPGEDWPSFFGPRGTRVAGAAIAPPLHLKWIVSLGSAQPYFSSPIIVGGRVYQGVSDGQAGFENAGVVCIDARTGEVLWKTPLPRDINATVCSDGERVYAVDCQGTVYGLEREGGRVSWQRDVYQDTDFHETNQFGWRLFLAPLTVKDGGVFVAGSRVLARLEAATGEMQWTRYNDINRSAPYPVSGLAVHGGLGYFEDEYQVAALRLDSGEAAWQRQLKELSGEVARERGTSSPLVSDEGAYFHHRNRLRKLDPATGEEEWSVPTGKGFNYVGVPAVSEDLVVASTTNRVIALDRETGSPAWTFETLPTDEAGLGPHQNLLNGSAPAIAGGHVFAGSDDGRFYALDVEDGRKAWEYNAGSPIKASPAISGNLVVVSNFAGNLMGFVAETAE